MRLLVYPHDLTIGGSQINAIDLAAGVAARGHDVLVYGVPGPLVSYIEERGLRFLPARRLRYRPAPSRIAQIAMIAKRESIDLVHAYEWSACQDAYHGAGMLLGIPLLCTVLSMSVSPLVPASVPLIMGTADLTAAARRLHGAPVWTLEPPIDVTRDNPTIEGSAFRIRHNVERGEFLIVTVSRLVLDLKLDALVRAIDATDRLAASHPVRLLVVGDGDARQALECRAASVNARHARKVITLAGADLDPRPAYAAADLVVGMGSSALRALAIGRPLIVQGEEGFSEIFQPSTLPHFLRQGFYGIADGAPHAMHLASQIEELLVDPQRRVTLGAYGRHLVEKRFSLERAVSVQCDIYRQVLGRPPRRSVIESALVAYRALGIEYANHHPRLKRHRRRHEDAMLLAASSQAWPPAYG